MGIRNIALVYGGKSVEHDVSILSATNIAKYAPAGKLNIIPIGVSKDGDWYLTDGVTKNIKAGEPISLSLQATDPSWKTESRTFSIDCAFVILHGTDGEDGSIQGLFQTLRIPFVGSGVLGSAMAMNKIVAKKMLIAEGVATAACLFGYQGSIPAYQTVLDKLNIPVIVKPAGLGSSVGVSKVNSEEEYIQAIEKALQFDTEILVETFVKGRELECAVLGNTNAKASPPGEIELSDDYEFYDFDAKYVDGEASKLQIPAQLDSETIEAIKKCSIDAYKALRCHDLARVDLFLTESNEILVNEVNTLPGFTNISMYPKLCDLMGVDYGDLINELVEFAIDRSSKQKELETNFNSGLS